LAKLVKAPNERPLKARLVASELGEGVRLLGIGIERTAEQNLVPVSLVGRTVERFARFRMRGFVGEMGGNPIKVSTVST